jgi:hypothetical protein
MFVKAKMINPPFLSLPCIAGRRFGGGLNMNI